MIARDLFFLLALLSYQLQDRSTYGEIPWYTYLDAFEGRQKTMSVRIGLAPPALVSGSPGVRTFWKFVDLSEDLGFDSVWLSDRPIGKSAVIDPLVGLAAVAARSSRLKFGTSVLLLSLRPIVLVAKELATLDYISDGRCFPAVGLGQEDPREYLAFGTTKQDRGRRVDEAIPLLRRLWTEDHINHQGKFYNLENVTVEPKPIQQPTIPIWIGGRSRAAQDRVGRLGDGWLASGVTPSEVAEGTKVVFETAASVGRYIEEDHIGVILGFRIEANRKRAIENSQPHIIRSRPDVPFTEFSAIGTADDVIATLQQFIAAGTSKFVLRPMCTPAEMEGQIRQFGTDVLPQFHLP